MTTHDRMREVLVEALGVDEDEVTVDAELVNDLGAESIDFLDIKFRVEKEFGIEIEDGELQPRAEEDRYEGVIRVRDMVEFVEKKLQGISP